jgi:hypothetical protein
VVSRRSNPLFEVVRLLSRRLHQNADKDAAETTQKVYNQNYIRVWFSSQWRIASWHKYKRVVSAMEKDISVAQSAMAKE